MPRKGDAKPMVERFFEKVKKTKSCWLWVAGRFGTDNGETRRYGCFMVSKAIGTKLAHRVSWEIHNGPIPSGMYVCHTCDVPLCVNPSHLFIGTQKDNAMDMVNKKRNYVRAREKCHFSKITRRKAEAIRLLYLNRKTSVKEVIKEAARIGVKRSQFYNIVGNRSWL